MFKRSFVAVLVLVCFSSSAFAQAEGDEAARIMPKRSSFDATATPELEVRRTTTGHLLVKTTLNGKDGGWWILDTGAGMSCIDKDFADELKLADAGGITASGMGGTKETKLRSFDSLSLGGIKLEDGKLLELNVKMYSVLMGAGVPIHGIIGHDCFLAGVFEIDMNEPFVSVHDPKTFKLNAAKQGEWTDVQLVARRPAVKGQIENSEPGLIVLDTGSNEGLLVHSPTVEKLKLLENRKTGRGRFGGVGGMKAVKTGKLASVTMGGCEIKDVPASFSETKDGVTANDEALATAGGKFLRNFRMVINQSTNQIAFSQTHAPTTQPATKSDSPSPGTPGEGRGDGSSR